MEQETLSKILADHKKWLQSDGGERANLRNAGLRNADLRRADLRGANLRNADLRSADLRGADLRNADLRNADLRGADLRNADLRRADLRGADLDYSSWPLWCGSIRAKIDSRLSKQLVYHAICNMPEGDRADFLTDPVKYANEFHQIEECGKLKW